jgi:hypothetical protein
VSTSSPPALRRHDGLDPSIPWDVIVFRRMITSGSSTSSVEITIDRAKLARAFARRARANSTRKTICLFGAIVGVILHEDLSSESQNR